MWDCTHLPAAVGAGQGGALHRPCFLSCPDFYSNTEPILQQKNACALVAWLGNLDLLNGHLIFPSPSRQHHTLKLPPESIPCRLPPPPTEAILIILTCHLWCSEPRVTFCFSTECHAGQSSTAWLCQARVAGCVFQGAAASSDYTASRLLWGTLRVWGGRTLEACLFAVCFSIFWTHGFLTEDPVLCQPAVEVTGLSKQDSSSCPHSAIIPVCKASACCQRVLLAGRQAHWEPHCRDDSVAQWPENPVASSSIQVL